MNWRMWVRGLAAAVVNSVASAGVVAIVDPSDFNLTSGLPKLGSVCGGAAIMGFFLYLKQHPLPEG